MKAVVAFRLFPFPYDFVELSASQFRLHPAKIGRFLTTPVAIPVAKMCFSREASLK
jgi:hypothetical protein